VTRMPGSNITSCDRKEFDQVQMAAGNDRDGHAIAKTLEGEVFVWDCVLRDAVSDLQVFRNFDVALKGAGFTMMYEESPASITARQGETWYNLQTNGTHYYQTVVNVRAMTQEVTEAASLADELNKSGHVAVYGIHFDTGKAAILPDSENTLGEIVKMLQKNADVKLSLEGHTDNVGPAASNQALSEKRAQSGVSWLTGHGIVATRLKAKGWGQTKPVEENGTEDDRTKNRRVELVKIS
jgi:OOP family OmpA-OmpF porin